VVTREVAPDYYAVLQVHPDADREVIEAAYRQLIKKYHPDLARGDPAIEALYHQRAKALNEAFAVLRDEETRRQYDRLRIVVGTRPGPRAAPPPPPSASPPPEWARPTSTDPASEADFVDLPTGGRDLPAPLSWLAAAYYLLPGPYEWERGRRQEAWVAVLVPLLGVVAFALGSGRLDWVIGTSPNADLLAWAIVLVASFPLWPALPRIALATVPSLVLLNAEIAALVSATQIPLWLAWAVLSLISLVLSARLYVFSVLPMLGLCWLMSRFS